MGDVAPHIKRGRRYAEKQVDGESARFVDITLPKRVADMILEIDKMLDMDKKSRSAKIIG